MTDADPRTRFLTKAETAALIPGGVSVRTLDRWHARRIGPPRIRIGNTVMYSRASVAAFLERKLAEAEAQYAAVEAGR